MGESWKQKRDRLCKLIKEISDMNGGDDIEWLREYCKDIVVQHKNNIDVALACFMDIKKNHL